MRRTNFLVAIGVLSGLLAFPRPASAQTPPPWMPCSGVNLIDQKFPVTGPE
jgi:hypothetical protein